MKKSFLKSVVAGVLGLALLSSCSGVMEKMGMHKCSGKKHEASAKDSSKKSEEKKSSKKAKDKK